MPQPRRCAGFAQKTKPRRFITEILFTDDLQRHRASEIDVERFVSDPHRAATQFDRFPIFTRDQSVMLKSLFRLFVRVHRNLGSRRLAGRNAASKTLAEHANWAEFHRSREFIAAARADASGLRFHGSDHLSEAIKASQRPSI
jgi:hypothetical protein